MIVTWVFMEEKWTLFQRTTRFSVCSLYSL